ncbi:unnamed protein product [Lathyrus sativus]|nr:unnamed protein product [Lathyrus sativus]
MKQPVELLKEVKKVSFTAIVHIFMGSCNHNVVKKIESLFEDLMNGLNSLPINVPGFTFHKALKAQEKIVKILEPAVSERRMKIKNRQHMGEKKDFMDILLDMKDVNGRKMKDGDISDLLIGLLAAGHESTTTGIMWTIIYLTNHPHFLKKVKIASDGLKHRVFEVSLADLRGDEEQAFRKIRLRAEDVQGKNVMTNFWGINLTTDKLR